MFKYFTNALIFTILSISISLYLGGLQFALVALILGIIEISLSFDNAIVNASVLTDMSPIWQKRFLTWGILIAVFGMRFALPIMIIMGAGHVGIITALNIALFEPVEYQRMMTACHMQVMAFGGTFLLLVALNYFIDAEKKSHWFTFIEQHLAWIDNIEYIKLIITGLIILFVCIGLRNYELLGFLFYSGISILIYTLINKLGDLLNVETDVTIVKNGLAGFLYLEVLDASFSFDGVISSFIITNNIILIALGLGIGAIFIRSFTLLFVDKGVLQEYKYLEAGAFYSIFILAIFSFLSIYMEVSSIITGCVSVAVIALSFFSSVRHNQNIKSI